MPWLELTILPNNITWLRSFLNFDFSSEEAHDSFLLVVEDGSIVSFFSLKSSKSRAWLLASIKKFLLFDSSSNSAIDVPDLFPFLILDIVTSVSEPSDDFAVVVGESNLGNLDSLVWIFIFFTIESEIFHLADSVFKLVLNEEFELSCLSHCILRVEIVLLPMSILLWL